MVLISPTGFFVAETMVTVGWGKKETQFHGSEGKEAAKRQEAFVEELVEGDDGLPRISWKGDGHSFATLVSDSGKGGPPVFEEMALE